MAGKSTKSWETVRAQKPLNEARVATYRRLMEAEALLDPIRRRRGVSEEAVADALAIAEPDGTGAQSEHEAYLAALARYVAALGGRLELRGVFGRETVLLTLPGGEKSPPKAE